MGKTTEVDLTKGIPRECIECDGPNCSSKSPQKRCSRCRTVFYCSVACQKEDWREHAPYCIPIERMRAKPESESELFHTSELLQGSAAIVDPHQECSICLTSPMKQPVTLKKCKHSFCTNCIIEWQKQTRRYDRTLPGCPYCRTNTENVENTLLERAALLAGQANVRSNISDEGRSALRREALSCIDRILETKDPSIQAYCTKAELLVSLGEGQAAVDAVESLLKENTIRREHPLAKVFEQINIAEAEGAVVPDSLQELAVEMYEEHGEPATRLHKASMFGVHMMHSRAFEIKQDWESAIDCYKRAFMELEGPESVSAVEQRKLFMGLAACAYKAGKYDMAISTSDAAIEMNRHFDEVHKYKALALKQIGKIDEAIETMNQAVLYETPWNNENISKALAFYNQLLAERHT